MKYELDTARAMNKPIIAIRPWCAAQTPLEVSISANTIVGWSTSSIVDAIRKYSI